MKMPSITFENCAAYISAVTDWTEKEGHIFRYAILICPNGETRYYKGEQDEDGAISDWPVDGLKEANIYDYLCYMLFKSLAV